MTSIFISYARRDNEKPPDKPDANGFVSHLYSKLKYELGDIGGPTPQLWIDKVKVPDDEPFDPLLDLGVAGAALLVIILSRNWAARPYCRKELRDFRAQFAGEDPAVTDRRIILVRKASVPEAELPPGVPRQSGFSFFKQDPEDGEVTFFFTQGRPGPSQQQVAEYDSTARRLAERLAAKSEEFGGGKPQPPLLSKAPPEPAAVLASAGRNVFVAKPSGDMDGAYRALVAELAAHKYIVIPDPAAAMPNDGDAARALVRHSLAHAELAVHLLGSKKGFVPDGEAMPIARLQLELAAQQTVRAGANGALAPLPRLIWAPKRVPDAEDGTPDRDPQSVYADVNGGDGTLRDSDKLVGDSQGRFIEFVLQRLITRPPPRQHPKIPPRSKILLEYDESDRRSVAVVHRSLELLDLAPLITGHGDAAAREARRRAQIQNCDAVLLCWSQAQEIWVRSLADRLEDDERDRGRNFVCRSVIQMEPEGPDKEFFRATPPRAAIDLVIDATGAPCTPEALATVLRTHLLTDGP